MFDKKISILMGIYNNETTLEEAVASIQAQTYTNWELILCDDASTDNTYNLAYNLSKNDSRIKLIKNDINSGLNITLNKCLKLATGDYIARMDGDDISVPCRFEKQVEFLNSHSEFDIVSSAMILFDETGEWGKVSSIEFPQPYDVVTSSPICHAPTMMTKKCILDVGGYTENKKMLRVEDVNLWIKLYTNGYRCYNIQEPLYKMRNNKNAFKRRKLKYRYNSTYVRLLGCKSLNLGVSAYFKSFIPLILGFIPSKIRITIRKIISKK